MIRRLIGAGGAGAVVFMSTANAQSQPASHPLSIPAPPPTTQKVAVESLHGVEVKDPFRWLEGDAKGNVTPEVAA